MNDIPLCLTNDTGTSFLSVEWFDDATACERDAPSMLVGDQCISLQKTNCRRKLVLTCCSGLA